MKGNKQPKEKLDQLQQKFVSTMSESIGEMENLCQKINHNGSVDSDKMIIRLTKLLNKFIGSSGSYGFYNHSRLASKAQSFAEQFRESPKNKELVNRLQNCLTSLASLPIDVEMMNLDFAIGPIKSPGLVFILDKHGKESYELKDHLMLTIDEVTIFTHIKSLLEALKERTPAIIIFNIDTVEEAVQISRFISRKSKAYSIIFLSQDGSFATRYAAIQCGADFFELKPFDPKIIGEKVFAMMDEQNGHKTKILAVIDNEEQQKYFELLLTELNCDIQILNNPPNIFTSILSFEPDAIILDMKLPQISGPDLTRLIRQYKNYASIPIIFISSDNSVDSISEAFQAGGDEYFVKPVDIEVLYKTIRSRVRRHREINRLIHEDGLTGLLNHRSTHNQLHSEIVAAKRYEFPLSIVEIDVDKFKLVNDTHGHPAGDKVLKNLAMLLKSHLRESDHIGRIGGEEFLVIMPSTTMKDAHDITERLRVLFSEIDHEDKGSHIYCTFSAGIAQLDKADTLNTFLKRADEGLYEAKASGRNQSVVKKPLRHG
ncbi:diguanylate cyclase [Legionella sp. W05-934-2]|jgi:diguanylate cyclase (GGDEF)-like protein|uniref:diguanylate cyclase n=1 Tax=Legionella sp. W05-934-2 TaxID=1198649 RepID=UPI0034637825